MSAPSSRPAPGVPAIAAEGETSASICPTVPTRSLDAYRLEALG